MGFACRALGEFGIFKSVLKVQRIEILFCNKGRQLSWFKKIL